ncbi:hypothetical protein LXL04_020039 [Taraxacum kok-saghyz]
MSTGQSGDGQPPPCGTTETGGIPPAPSHVTLPEPQSPLLQLYLPPLFEHWNRAQTRPDHCAGMSIDFEEPDASSNPVITDAPVLVKVAGKSPANNKYTKADLWTCTDVEIRPLNEEKPADPAQIDGYHLFIHKFTSGQRSDEKITCVAKKNYAWYCTLAIAAKTENHLYQSNDKAQSVNPLDEAQKFYLDDQRVPEASSVFSLVCCFGEKKPMLFKEEEFIPVQRLCRRWNRSRLKSAHRWSSGQCVPPCRRLSSRSPSQSRSSLSLSCAHTVSQNYSHGNDRSWVFWCFLREVVGCYVKKEKRHDCAGIGIEESRSAKGFGQVGLIAFARSANGFEGEGVPNQRLEGSFKINNLCEILSN